jgi:hypothetical protein
MGFVNFLPIFVIFSGLVSLELCQSLTLAQTIPYAIEFDDRYYKELKAKKPKSDQERFDLWRTVHPLNTKKMGEPTKTPPKPNQPNIPSTAPILSVPAMVPTTATTVTQDGNLDELIFPEGDPVLQTKKPSARLQRKAKAAMKKTLPKK